ncbi:hypothetical protein QBC41DRAFT_320850 [Cercophora samala]|uniref:Uncharacterized protein n=1 Tax=Cercophora samala TaxID=330535 RepID=A0AA40DBG5_9PEZI|nr:hypothetical protein QBC41DRAFT_320850 [Cercophora samala]
MALLSTTTFLSLFHHPICADQPTPFLTLLSPPTSCSLLSCLFPLAFASPLGLSWSVHHHHHTLLWMTPLLYQKRPLLFNDPIIII